MLSDLFARLKRDRPTALVQAGRLGGLRLYAAHHVYAEVLRKIGEVDWSPASQGDVEQLMWREYQPLIHYVDVSDDRLPVPVGLERLASRDRSDVGTAVLAGLLAPTMSFAIDRDLCDDDWAVNKWVPAARATRQSVELDAMVALFMRGGRWAGSWVRDAIRRRPVAASAACGLAVGLLVGVAIRKPDVARRWLGNVEMAGRSAGAKAVEIAVGLIGSRVRAFREIGAAWVLSGESTELIQRVARVLAVAPGPLTAAELREACPDVVPLGTEPEELARILERQSPFVAVPGGWQLGRTMLSFGPPSSPVR